jgi:repressor LexA
VKSLKAGGFMGSKELFKALGIGSRLKELRKGNGLTMRALAADLGIPVTTYCNYENDSRAPNAAFLKSVADYFGVTIDYLLGYDSSEADPVEDDCPRPHHNAANNDGGCMQRLRQLRRDQNLSMKELGRILGCSESTISLYENGKREPDFRTLQKIADYFGVTIDYLLGRDQPADQTPEEALQLPPGMFPYHPKSTMPVLGRVAAGLPMFAEENICGYIANDYTDGESYYGLIVRGDSMNAAGIDDGDIVVVRQQSGVDDGQIAVVLVNGNDATIKYFRQQGDTVILMPKSYNPTHQIQFYDLNKVPVRIIGRVVQIRKNI